MQSRLWILVWNNYSENWKETFQEISAHTNVQWIGGVPEVAPSTGTPHIQGLIYLRKKTTKTGVIGIVKNGIHIGDARGRPCNGTFGANIAYITKTGAEVCEYGNRPPVSEGGGERDRWRSVRELAIAGDFDVIEENYFDIWVRYDRKLYGMYKPPAIESCRVVYMYGPPRTGKDHWVHANFPDMYKHMGAKWFDDYANESVIYFAEFDKDKLQSLGVQKFKELADKWNVRVESKGASRLIRPSVIVLTSNYRPSEVFGHLKAPDLEAVKARVSEIYFKDSQESEPVNVEWT